MIANGWDNFTDWIENLGEYIDQNKLLIFMVVCILLAIGSLIAILTEPPMDVGFESRQLGQVVLLGWDVPAGGADLYEIQGRQFDGEWNSFMYSEFPFAQIGMPPGVMSFRVRAWTKSGPGPWSESTEYFLFIVPAGNENENPGPSVKPAVVLRT